MIKKAGIIKIIGIIIIYALLVFAYLFYIPTGTLGEPNIMVRSTGIMIPRANQVLDDGENIYISFGDGGVIQIYDLCGEYKYTISMHSHSNGRFEMALEDRTLYVHDKQNNLYEYYDGELVKFLYSNAESREYVDGLSFRENSDNYEVRSGSVWDISSENERCIIRKPMIFDIIFCLGLIIFICIILCEKYNERYIMKERNMW